MKMVLVSLLLCIVFVTNGFSQDKGVDFQHISLAEALTKIGADQKNQKLVFVDCYTSWCVPCAEMARTIFPEKSCGDFMNPRFVSIKLDMEKKGEGTEVSKKYAITAYPTFLILNAKGEEVNRVVGGAKTVDDFLKKLQAALQEENSLKNLKNAFETEKSMATGLPYMKALIDRSMDPSKVFNVLFDSLSDAYRFNEEYLRIVFSTIRFGDTLFKKIMLEKPRIDRAIGAGVVNRMLYDMVRGHMYCIANEVGDRYNVHYTPQEVEMIAYTMALLNLPLDEAQTHIFRIALYVVNKDMDGMIDYYKRYIGKLSPSEAYKVILESVLSSKIPRLNEAQKKAVKEYFELSAKAFSYEAKQYQQRAEMVK
ncbi:thioredoxin family protein [Filimonas effusa]|uniref:Thioredoxin n=1 Tax=Filimonas effusa TaxID=2508721 RepID=A0A4Q1DD32_9BACT|nr:thioredoxin family protein [Filimonas effusa]RXK86775.1 thioredoxin [Filimonas effusa]